MCGGGEVDLGMNLRDVQLLLHGHDELVLEGLVQLHVPGGGPRKDGVGPEHPQEGGGLLMLLIAQIGQHMRGHHDVALCGEKISSGSKNNIAQAKKQITQMTNFMLSKLQFFLVSLKGQRLSKLQFNKNTKIS
jgi:hypothetical protein